MVFYRKYRSQTIDELDSQHVRDSLTAILSTKNVPHAFLFTGPKGLGKTSTARIVAKVVNCVGKKRDGIEPCNTCEECTSITNGTNLDVLEIDAASNRGIDEIRDLKEKIRLSPVSAKKKVYIIDEVHMLTTEAFNALLKTLEEPPDHALFMLCTTELHKVPATILSRCFSIHFSLATSTELVRSFKRIVKGEGIEIDEEALRTIARLAEGGFRDGVKILEELASLAKEKKITKELVEGKYQVTSIMYFVSELVTLIEKKDTKSAFQLVSKMREKGIDLRYFLEQLVAILHATLLSKVGIPDSEYIVLTTNYSVDELKKIISEFTKAYSDMKVTVLPQLPLELVILALTTEKEQQVQEMTVVTTKEGTIEPKGNGGNNEVSVTTLRKKVGDIQRVKILYGEQKEKSNEAPASITVSATSAELLHFTADGDITREWLGEFWRCLISEMKHHNHTIAGVLRGCVLKNFDRKNLVIETAYKFHKEKLDEAKTLQALSEISTQLTGKPIAVSVVLKEK